MRLPRRALLASMASTMTTPARALVVDSHLHVWSSTSAFAPGKEPPANLGDSVASAEAFAAACQESGVDRALIVQPINYLFDHTYVSDAEQKMNPSLTWSRRWRELDVVAAMASS